jgi:hypothetical protein
MLGATLNRPGAEQRWSSSFSLSAPDTLKRELQLMPGRCPAFRT